MNSTNFDITRLLPESSEGSSNSSQEPEVSPITVRQNIAAETTVNLRFSLKYNFVALLTSIAKVIATFTVIIHVPHFCMGLKQSWLFAMTLYDLFYIRLIILTIKNIYEMNNLIRQHEPALNYNLQNRNSQDPSAAANQGSDYNDELFEDDEIREYDVEQYHRDLRVSSLSPIVAENRRRIKRLTRTMDTIYFMIFAMGQLIYFLGSGGSCDTVQTDTLMLIYVFMGWIWILSPLILLVLGCLCLPFLLFCIYFFARGTRVPASKVDLKKLPVKTYSSEIQGSKECVICMLDYHDGDKIIQLECSPMHHFHETCLKRWLKINGQCPVCRTRIGQPGPHKHENHQQHNAENSDETENHLI